MQTLVTYRDLKAVYGIPYTPQHLLRLQKSGKFPLRRKSGNFNFWTAADIEAWIASLPVAEVEAPLDGE